MTPTLQMLHAVNAVIDKAREIHDGIPEVTVVLGASGKMRNGQKHGHFAPKAWESRHGEDLDVIEATRMGEVFLSGESLQRGAVATVGTILHELVHAYCHEQEIKDTSNGHRYHNKKFKEIANEFGLDIEQAKTIGWSVTSVPEATQETYADEIKALDEALVQYRVGNAELKITQPQKKFKMGCMECGDSVQVTKTFADRHQFSLRCEEHDEVLEFWVEETK